MINAAIMITMCMVSLLMMQKSKKKKGDDNPDVGYRYWGDAMSALATLSPRTSAVWFNRVFQQGEEYTQHFHMPTANYYGEQYNIGSLPVNTLMTTAFRSDISSDWEAEDMLRRTCRVPRFTRVYGQNPQFPSHYPGVAIMCYNQAFMGLNAATLQSYVGIVSSIPGTVAYLRSVGPEYDNEALWVRWRNTVDLSWTVGINPVAIVADILLDQMPKDKINWASFAHAGKKLITEYPYMWFSVAMGPRTQQEAVQYILTRAKLAQKRMPDGTIGLRLLGEVPENGPAAFAVIDAMRDFSEFSFSKASTDEADVINELRGEYSAARYSTDNTDNAQFEGHLLGADMHVMNTGNIVLTGVRKQQTQDLDFLSWPDDARAYLWEVLARHERPYLEGSVSGGMFLSKYGIGDNIRIKVMEEGIQMVFDRVFEIQEMSVSAYPSETVSLEVRESSAWYGLFEECVEDQEPNKNPNDGWDSGQEPVPEPVLMATVPTIIMCGSPHSFGSPAAYAITSGVIEDLGAAQTFLVADCADDSPAMEDEPVISESGVFPLMCVLAQDVTINSEYPGLITGTEIVAEVWTPKVDSTRPTWNTIDKNCHNFAGTMALLFDGAEGATANYVMFSNATLDSPSGLSVLTRAITIYPYKEDERIFVRIQGLYATDGKVNITCKKGSVIAVLPPSNALTDYFWSPAPVPASMGHTEQLGGMQYNLRTTLATSRITQKWAEGFCGEYQLDDYWLQTPQPTVYLANLTEPPHLPSRDSVFTGATSNTLIAYINAADLTDIQEDSDLYGIPAAYTAGLDMRTTLSESSITPEAESSPTAIAYMTVVMTLKNSSGTVLRSVELQRDKAAYRFSLAALGISFPADKKVLTEFTVTYNLRSIMLDSRTTLRPTTVKGPVIYG